MIRNSSTNGDATTDLPRFELQEVTDPAVIAEFREVDEQAKRNGDWLQAHWPDLLPEALGKCLVVAGQEAFVSDSPDDALSKARAAHPDDKGMLVQYVLPHKGLRVYGIRR